MNLIATIKGASTTISTSVGDEISLEVSTTLPSNILRWRHNGALVSVWNGLKLVNVANVRKADEGIYECYEDGHREDGLHAIVRLIVRGKFEFIYTAQQHIKKKMVVDVFRLFIPHSTPNFKFWNSNFFIKTLNVIN